MPKFGNKQTAEYIECSNRQPGRIRHCIDALKAIQETNFSEMLYRGYLVKGYAMTSTEKRIARLWKAGKTSQEIASEIGMNERMVRAILDDLNLG